MMSEGFFKTIIIIVVQIMLFCQLSCFVYLAAKPEPNIIAGVVANTFVYD